ncbi:hypothetical protein [Paenibacillus sp. YN15]|uniref:hypothetical protein n=1 Tax=Paenibacillus sp. YN15 TaxID=1742774 RepID=UPI000DCE340A|nr:hypothetical protein [Paenibacillus sp. YN15]RAU96845.1 hypothetical protein DQG13_20030 [Paenibacillus sp. YN15]
MADIELILGADNGHSPADKLSQAYPKINRNFTELSEELADETATRIANDNAETAARIANDNAEIAARIAADEAHAESETAHPAENITYAGEVTAADTVKDAIDTLKTTLDQAVISGDSGPEAATARYNTESGETYTTLQQRLDTEYAETDGRISAAESEIVTARGTYSSVGERFGGVDAQLADLRNYLDYMPINGGDFDGNDPSGVVVDGGTY